MPTAPWVADLLAWYAHAARDLPWRGQSDPYRVWLSEIMLQQTRVESVKPYYARFLTRFPRVADLAATGLQEVLREWEGLGYYSRARSLHKAASMVTEKGAFPRSLEGLRALPGVGPYTAAAIGSICFDVAEPVVDGNVLRVAARLFGLEEDVARSGTRDRVADLLRPFVPPGRAGDFNQALMELGALVCLPRAPACPTCPLRHSCQAHMQGRQQDLPVKTRRDPGPHHEIAVGVIWRQGRVLVARRPEQAMLGGLWEFPGGKRRPGETLTEAARREIREETGLEVEVREAYATVGHAYTHFRITLTAFRCTSGEGEAGALASDEVRWVRPEDLAGLPFPRANRKVVAAVLSAR